MIGTLYTQVQYLVGNVQLPNVGSQRLTAGNNNTGDTAGAPTAKTNVAKPTQDEKIRGNKNAPIALIEYSDFDCPFCTQFHATAKQALDFYKDKLMWVYRDFPLNIHPDAQKKAEAGECITSLAGVDKFWAFADIIYARTETLAEVPDIAAEIGVNKAQFTDCLNNGKKAAKVQEDFDSGDAAGVTGTPGNFIMNVKTGEVLVLKGAVPLESVKQAVDKLLAKL